MFDPGYQHEAHTPLCGHAHRCSNPTAQIDFIAADREQRESQLFGKHIALYDEHLEIPSGKRAAGVGRQRKHARSNCAR